MATTKSIVTRGKWEATLLNIRVIKKQIAALSKRVSKLEKAAKA